MRFFLPVGAEVLKLAILNPNITAGPRVKAVEAVHHSHVFQGYIEKVAEKKDISSATAERRRATDERVPGTGADYLEALVLCVLVDGNFPIIVAGHEHEDAIVCRILAKFGVEARRQRLVRFGRAPILGVGVHAEST